MNWIKRNSEAVLIVGLFAVVSLTCYAMWLGRNDEPSSIRVELTAHAQKPEPPITFQSPPPGTCIWMDKNGNSHVTSCTDPQPPKIGTPEFADAFLAAENRRIKDYIEQHCVAVLPSNEGKWGTPISHLEQTLKMRCH